MDMAEHTNARMGKQRLLLPAFLKKIKAGHREIALTETCFCFKCFCQCCWHMMKLLLSTLLFSCK